MARSLNIKDSKSLTWLSGNRSLITTLEAAQSPEEDSLLSISAVCDLFGITQRALRFYEEKGLLKPHRRGRHRRYDAEDVERIKMIVYLRHLGLSLQRIHETLIRPANQPVSSIDLSIMRCEQRLTELEKQRVTIELTMRELRRTLSELRSARFLSDTPTSPPLTSHSDWIG